MRKRLAGLAFAALLTCAANDAWAGPHEESIARFDEGRALVKAGRPAEAVPKFIASLAAEPSAVAALNLADCYERIGKLASARDRFKQAEQLSSTAGDTLRASEARKRAEVLESRLSTITLLPPPAGVQASAWVDGTPLPSDGWGKPRAFDPGPHEVVLQTPDGKRQTKVVTLAEEGTKATVPFDLESTGGVVTEKKKTEPEPAKREEPQPDSGLRTVAIVAGGIGAAALITGGVTGILALGAKSDLESACATYPRCPQSQQGELEDIDNRGHTMATVSTITFIAGAALLTTGVVLWILSSPSEKSEKTLRAFSGSFTF